MREYMQRRAHTFIASGTLKVAYYHKKAVTRRCECKALNEMEGLFLLNVLPQKRNNVDF